MAHSFQFYGGVAKPSLHVSEKFLMFFVVGGKEIPLYQMIRDGLVHRDPVKGGVYHTGNNIAKIFTASQGFGIAKRYYSFYFRFRDSDVNPVVTIKGFAAEGIHRLHNFKGTVTFLKKSEILSILDDESESRIFMERQRTLPVEMLRTLVEVDRSNLKKNIREIRIGRRRRVANGELGMEDKL